MHTVFVRNYPAVPADRKEILRYAGAGDDVSGIAELLERCLAEASGREAGRVCWCEFPIREIGEKLSLGFAETDSAALRKNLRGCGSIIVFAATVGMAFDRLIARYAAISPVHSGKGLCIAVQTAVVCIVGGESTVGNAVAQRRLFCLIQAT